MKRQRQQTLLELVRREPLPSQEEIRRRLGRLGHRATQSTISRDLEELGLVRVRNERGRLHYAAPDASAPQRGIPVRALLQEFLVAVESSGNLVLLKTPPGAANTVARGLDASPPDGVIGTVAGDDTIIVVVRDGVRASAVARRMKSVAGIP
jgi:transcriptional regulator of arginine metabolism